MTRSPPGTANLPIGVFSGGPVWHREYWDRYIRDQRHFERTVEYIHQNPVKAGLVVTAETWPWSSAFPGNAFPGIPFPGSANLPIGGGQSAVQENGVPRVWHSRGYLPHFESSEATQHVTFHLADGLPQAVLVRWEAELKTLPAEKRDAERRKRVDAWMDAGHGSCVLRNPGIAGTVQESLLAFDSQRYRLLAWAVMPNHVHVLFQSMNGWTVAEDRRFLEEVHGPKDL